MNRSPRITLLELLVATIVVFVLLLSATSSLVTSLTRGSLTQILSNMKQLHLVTQQWTLDNTTTGNPCLWTCSNTTPLTRAQWEAGLVPAYLSTNDLAKLTSYTPYREWWELPKKTETNLIAVYAVTEDDPGDTLFTASRNWPGLGAPALSPSPFPGTKGFIVFRKAGDGAILLPRQIADTNLIGGGGLHGYLELR